VIVRVIVVECESDPLVPVKVTVNVPRLSTDEPVNVTSETPDPPSGTVTRPGLKPTLTPVGGVADNETVPLNPFKLVTVIAVESIPNLGILRLDGEALMLKSGGGVTVRK
jgi:hypothetical protein